MLLDFTTRQVVRETFHRFEFIGSRPNEISYAKLILFERRRRKYDTEYDIKGVEIRRNTRGLKGGEKLENMRIRKV